MKAREKILQIEKELGEEVLEREELIRGCLLALLSRQHLMVIGPPGTAKSYLTEKVAQRIEGSRFFSYLLTRYTTPDEIWGPVDISAYTDQGVHRRITRGKLAEVEIALLDEIWKANSSILNTLLKAMDERRQFDNNGGALQLPLISLFGASNEFPESEELDALFDRFAFRFMVKPLRDRDSRKEMLQGASRKRKAVATKLSLEELKEMQAGVQKVTIPDAIYEKLLDLWEKLEQEGILPTDRKFKWTLQVLKASAFLSGRSEVSVDDLPTLKDLLWNREEDFKVVAKVIASFANPFDQQGLEFLDQALELRDKAVASGSSEDGISANSELKKIKTSFKKLLEQTKAAGKGSEKLESFLQQIEDANKAVLAKCLGLEG